MPVISLDLGQIGAVRADLQRRVGDLHTASESVVRVAGEPSINRDDPSVRSLPGQLEAIEHGLSSVRRRLDDEQGRVGSFLSAAHALNRAGTGLGVGVATLSLADVGLRLLLPGRRGPFALVPPIVTPGRPPWWTQHPWRSAQPMTTRGGVPRGAHPASQRWQSDEQERSHRLWPNLRSVTRAGTAVLRRSGRLIATTTSTLARGVSAAWQRHVVDPAGQLKRWLAAGWRTITSAFSALWDAAWSAFQTVRSALREVAAVTFTVAEAVVNAACVVARAAPVVFGAVVVVFRYEFEKAPQRGSRVEWEENFTGSVTVDVPTPWKFDVRIRPEVTVKVEHFDNDTVEVTLGAEFAAGVALSLDEANLSPEQRVKAEIALMAALQGERTYRIANTLIGGRPAYQVFIEQQIARYLLLAIANSGSPTAVAARLALLAMAPEPSPVSTSGALSVQGEFEVDCSVGGLGVKVEGDAETEVRLTVNDDGSSSCELSHTIDGSVAATFRGVGFAFEGEVSATIRAVLDDKGMPLRIEVELEGEGAAGGTAGAEVSVVGADGQFLEGVRQRVTGAAEIPSAQRARLAQLVSGLPATMSELLAELGTLDVDVSLTAETDHYTEAKGHVGVDTPVVDVDVDLERRVYGEHSETRFERELRP